MFLKGCRNKWRMPLVFAICTNKQKNTYKTVFQQIKKNQPRYSPKKVNVDFELAAINAISEEFPNAKVQACNFHFKQSINRNLNTIGLKQRYERDMKFAREIREMAAIAFLPEHKVSNFLVYIYEVTSLTL